MLLRAKLTFHFVTNVTNVTNVTFVTFVIFFFAPYFYIFKRKNINIFIYKYLYISKKSFLALKSTSLNKVQK